MNRDQLKLAVGELLISATESGVPFNTAYADVIEAADKIAFTEMTPVDGDLEEDLARTNPPAVDIYDENDQLKMEDAEKFAQLIEEFFAVHVRKLAPSEEDRPTFSVLMALGAIEAAKRCVNQAAFECNTNVRAHHIDDAAVELFLVLEVISNAL
jgi:hypothetical protein